MSARRRKAVSPPEVPAMPPPSAAELVQSKDLLRRLERTVAIMQKRNLMNAIYLAQ